ncbi:MAG TPA: cupin domain-containing protein [Vicinamibacterales bacterium]|jgi:mannose-6-phosphate isomerase-like protein (cupin superfamily)|nr:cupin domain-containing protein [Vicinamibacterales bacterium]
MTRVLLFFMLTAALVGQESKQKGGYIIQHDEQVAKSERGPHDGPGQTVGYVFFDTTPNLHFSFRKRVLKLGAGIGYHEQHEDEVYYFLSGRGVMTLDDKPYDVGPGTAVLTRTGSSHGLKQVGNEDLVVIITYEVK